MRIVTKGHYDSSRPARIPSHYLGGFLVNHAPSHRRFVFVKGLLLAGGLLITGCGDSAAPKAAPKAGSDKAGSDKAGSDHAGSDKSTMNAGIVGAAKPLTHDEFEHIMEENNSLMKVLKLAIKEKDKEMASKALTQLAENASKSMGSTPDKNKEQVAAYLALFGAQRLVAQSTKALVEMDAWTAMGPSIGKLG